MSNPPENLQPPADAMPFPQPEPGETHVDPDAIYRYYLAGGFLPEAVVYSPFRLSEGTVENIGAGRLPIEIVWNNDGDPARSAEAAAASKYFAELINTYGAGNVVSLPAPRLLAEEHGYPYGPSTYAYLVRKRDSTLVDRPAQPMSQAWLQGLR